MQVEALGKAGVHSDNLHVEKVSARAHRRPAFEWALETLRPGDTLLVWSVDRLGRDVREIHKSLDIIRNSGARIRSITQGFIDSETPNGRFALNMLASLAENEWDTARQRTRAGVDAARRRGVRFGQPPKLTPKQQAQCRAWKRKGHTVREIVGMVAAEFKIEVSHGAVQNYCNPRPPKGKT